MSALAVSIELNELLHLEVRREIEIAVRNCIGDRSKQDDWKLWIYASASYCRIVIKGPVQTRDKFFFDGGDALPEKVRQWLESYPLS